MNVTEMTDDDVVKFREQKSDADKIHELKPGTVLNINGAKMKVIHTSKNGSMRLRPVDQVVVLVVGVPMTIDKVDHGDLLLKLAGKRF